MVRGTKLIALCGAMAVAVALLYLAHRKVPSEAQASRHTSIAAEQAVPSSDAAARAVPRASAARSGIQLPPPDAPLETVFDELATAADAGHVGAACRLAWSLQQCNSLDSRGSIPGFYVEGAARTPEGSAEERELVAEAAAAQERLARDKAACRGLDEDKLGQAASRMLQAAQLGHPASQAMFAMWPPFGPDLSLDEAEAALFHRDHALGFLHEAVASGEPAALLGLFDACHSGQIRLLHGTVEVGQDPVCALATALALRRFADPATASEAQRVVRESAGVLDGEQLRRAREKAAFYDQRFRAYTHYDFASGIFKPHLRDPCADLR